jgi:CBS-domain-containing membrane protein
MIKDYDLFNDPLADICRKAGGQKVKKFMYTPSEGEYVDESGSLGEAIHQLVIGHHQSLLVTQQKNIVGILRLTDVFAAVYEVMKDSCSV